MDVQCDQSMVDGEQWLPAAAAAAGDLFSEDSLMLGKGGGAVQAGIMGCGCGWSSLGPLMDSSSSSYNNSPVESVVGSTETESEEDDDYMADLALQMAHSMLLDDDDYKDNEETGRDFHWLSPQMKSKEDESAKSYMMSRSPQSILAMDGVDSKGSSKVSSPPSAVESPETWDLLFAAAAAAAGAGQVMRHSMAAAAAGTKTVPLYAKAVHGPYNTRGYDSASASASALYLDNGYHSSTNCFSGFSPKEKMTNNSSPFGSHRVWNDKSREEDMKFHSQHHLQHQRQPKQSQSRGQGWVRQAKAMQLQHQHVHYRSGSKPPGINNSSSVRSVRSDYPNPSWPPLKQAVGSGMRAVFLGSRGSGRESGGTGVFLPRRSGCYSDLRRKPPCSTVLLPSRIVHALNLNVEEISSQPNSNSGLLYNHRDALLSTPGASHGGNNTGRFSNYSTVIPRNAAPDYQKSPCFSSLSQIQGASHEIVLPQEWTY